MRWYAHLYTGKFAKQHRLSILRGLRNGKSMPSVYVITRALGPDGLLDIFRCGTLYGDYYAKQDPLVVGIALSRREALEVARNIVDDMYRENGDFDIDAFLSGGHT